MKTKVDDVKRKKYLLYILLGVLYPLVKVVHHVDDLVYARGIIYGLIRAIHRNRQRHRLFHTDAEIFLLAVLLGFSAGVMVYISFTELLGTAIEGVGFFTANIAFFIAVIDILVPHEYEEEHVTDVRLGIGKAGQKEESGLPAQLEALHSHLL